jgi:hypothetical protein
VTLQTDSLYGSSPEFINAVDRLPGVTYFVSMASDTRCWLKRPVVREKTYKYKGTVKTRRILEDTSKTPIAFIDLAKSINDFFWYRRKVSEGTKGPIMYEFTKRRVVLSKDGLPEKEVWLVIKRTLGPKPEYSFFISNAPVSTRLAKFVWLSGVRWAIEQCFEETKTELGMEGKLTLELQLFCTLIFFLLPFYRATDLALVQTNGAHTISFRPKMTTPLSLLQFQVLVEYLDGAFSLQKSNYFRYRKLWRNRHNQMDMVFLDVHLQHLKLLPLAELPHYLSN